MGRLSRRLEATFLIVLEILPKFLTQILNFPNIYLFFFKWRFKFFNFHNHENYYFLKFTFSKLIKKNLKNQNFTVKNIFKKNSLNLS